MILLTSATPVLSLSCPKTLSCLDPGAFAQAPLWPRTPPSLTVSSSDLSVTSLSFLPAHHSPVSSPELLCQGLRMLTPQYGKHHEAETTHNGVMLFGSPTCGWVSHSWQRGPVEEYVWAIWTVGYGSLSRNDFRLTIKNHLPSEETFPKAQHLGHRPCLPKDISLSWSRPDPCKPWVSVQPQWALHTWASPMADRAPHALD